jgi:hypothetical protein
MPESTGQNGTELRRMDFVSSRYNRKEREIWLDIVRSGRTKCEV